jgi:hypothetical protein
VPLRPAVVPIVVPVAERLDGRAELDPRDGQVFHGLPLEEGWVIAVSPLFIAVFMAGVFLLAGGWALFRPPRRQARPRGSTGTPISQKPMSHGSAPLAASAPDEAVMAAMRKVDTGYASRVRQLGEQLRGKVVVDSVGGHSGYLLRFNDGKWVAIWLDQLSSRMDFSLGEGDFPPSVTALLSNPAIPDASSPLDVDRPYAGEFNDIEGEARRIHGKPIVGVAIGERDFSLRFPDGLELEGTVFPNAAGHFTLRVFWEQW